MDRQPLQRLTHKAEHYQWIRDDSYGDPTYVEPPIERKCYREGKITMVRSMSGEEKISKLRLYFNGIFPINGKDKIVYDNEPHVILSYEQFDGLLPNTGTTVVYL